MLTADGITTTPPTCIFCGTAVGPFDVEDVFSKWTRKVLPKPLKVMRNHPDPSKRPYETNVLRATIDKAVNKKCNGGWMSVLEESAKPVLRDMMNPRPGRVPVRLDARAQRLAAFWTVHKALCLELSLRQDMPTREPGHISADHFRWLYERRTQREPPPNTQVWLFAYQAQEPGTQIARQASHGSVIVSDRTRDPRAPVGGMSTITVGCLGFQVFLRDIEASNADGQPEAFSPLTPPGWLQPFLIPIWPILDPSAAWLGNGPKGVVARPDRDTLITWGPMFTRPKP